MNADAYRHGDKKLRVVVVDNSKATQRVAKSLLEKAGYEVLTAGDGIEALALIAEFRPDIIFLDVVIPRLDGYQTCAIIKHNRAFWQTPVVLMTAQEGIKDRARGQMVGADYYLTKPFTRDELLQIVRECTVNSYPGSELASL